VNIAYAIAIGLFDDSKKYQWESGLNTTACLVTTEAKYNFDLGDYHSNYISATK
jgi:hypothetical protein